VLSKKNPGFMKKTADPTGKIQRWGHDNEYVNDKDAECFLKNE
jgi:hypothetical protein